MNKVEFTKIVEDIVERKYYIYDDKHNSFYIEMCEGSSGKKLVQSKVATGGSKGGSCWGNISEPYTNNVPDINFAIIQIIDEVLNKVCPDITMLKYKSILNILKTDETCDNEYYGNCTYYDIVYFDIDEFYEKLS